MKDLRAVVAQMSTEQLELRLAMATQYKDQTPSTDGWDEALWTYAHRILVDEIQRRNGVQVASLKIRWDNLAHEGTFVAGLNDMLDVVNLRDLASILQPHELTHRLVIEDDDVFVIIRGDVARIKAWIDQLFTPGRPSHDRHRERLVSVIKE